MKRAFSLMLFTCFFFTRLMAQQGEAAMYTVSLDLTKVNDDRVPVTMLVPPIEANTVEFQIPKIVPGTYSISDFGRFVKNFIATDAEGGALPVKQVSVNRWEVGDAGRLHKISYEVDDTFDSDLENPIFEPGGTNIEEGKNFVFNTFGAFGYLKGMKDMPYEVNITRPAGFYGATSMELAETNGNTDTYRMANYFDLADAPIMYCLPDTVTKMVGGAEILVSVYSPNDVLTADFVMSQVEGILEAQKDYMGGTLPIKKYAFIIYLFNGQSASGGYGALEHSYSSLYFLPEVAPEQLAQTIKDVSAHEFFHIITPLNIHSEEIGDFDFISPKMSKHLWLYEGLTEYQASHVQLVSGIFSLERYLEEVRDKMITAENYQDDLPFTEMSKYVLEKYEDEYGNVYMKGALIGLALDIMLRELSGGSYGIQDMLRDLSEEYGKTVSFDDEVLFDKITELTYPEVRAFFRRYVEGPEPLPLPELLGKVGVSYVREQETARPSLGIANAGLAEDGKHIVVNAVEEGHPFSSKKLRAGDVILEFHGEEMTVQNVMSLIERFRNEAEDGDKLRMVVEREVKGKKKKVKIKGKVVLGSNTESHVLTVMGEPSAEQLKLREAWMKGS